MTRRFLIFTCLMLSVLIVGCKDSIELNKLEFKQEEERYYFKGELYSGEVVEFWNKEDGIIKTKGEIFNGVFVDSLFVFYPEGIIQKKTFYSKEGIIEGTPQYYLKNGNLAQLLESEVTNEKGIIFYQGGPYNGHVISTFDGEKLKFRKEYQNGKLDGIQEFYYETGEVFLVGFYKNGVQDGVFNTFEKEGPIYKREEYKNGEQHGLWYLVNNNNLQFLISENFGYDNYGKIVDNIDTLYKFHFQEGKLHGDYFKIKFLDGDYEGLLRGAIYYNHGYLPRIAYNKRYLEGKLDGESTETLYDNEGRKFLITKYNYRSDKRHGNYEHNEWFTRQSLEKGLMEFFVEKSSKGEYRDGELYNYESYESDKLNWKSYYIDEVTKVSESYNEGIIFQKVVRNLQNEVWVDVEEINFYPNGKIKSKETINEMVYFNEDGSILNKYKF